MPRTRSRSAALVLAVVLALGIPALALGAPPQAPPMQFGNALHAVGTWSWQQGATIMTASGPMDLPFELFGMPSLMRLGADGGVIDVCGLIHPASLGASYTANIALPGGGSVPLTLTVPVSGSDGIGSWKPTATGVVVNWHKLLFNAQGQPIGSMLVILEMTRITAREFEGYSKVLFLDASNNPMPLPVIAGADPTAVIMGPTRGRKLPVLRFSDLPF